jgi:mxaJ protein
VQRCWGSLIIELCLGLLVCLHSGGQGSEPKELKVCADPDNLPYSNEQLEGFENKIAALIAQDLGAQLAYT